MKFIGTYIEFENKLKKIIDLGNLKKLNENQIQLRIHNGAIMNWYPSTGTINFQGPSVLCEQLSKEVSDLLNNYQEDQLTTVQTPPLQVTDALSKLNNQSHDFNDSELIIGLVGAVGTELENVVRVISERLQAFKYIGEEIKISRDVIPKLTDLPEFQNDNYLRIDTLMTKGNEIRTNAEDNSILALTAAAKINQIRTQRSKNGEPEPLRRSAFIISSLKHPDEVQALRKIYSNGFFLIGVYSDQKRRHEYLTKNKRIENNNALKLIERDADESLHSGQHTRDTFHLSDFFVNFDGDADKLQNDIWRIIDLVFGKPYVTPTFEEFAMFMAFSSSLRSADLSRQVGAVMTKDRNIISTGANDVPKYGGGLYWPEYNAETSSIEDSDDGRDYKRGFDSNAAEKKAIIQNILDKIPESDRETFKGYLEKSRIKDITEYGRVVHAEMESILACARSNISTKDAELFCTTFPCHNCAKHIIAAGIKRVVYVEPYPKSKAFDFHSDSISQADSADAVKFEPFVGVGPRSFFNLFSTSLGSGYPITRKTKAGETVSWDEGTTNVRMQMLPSSYIERETLAATSVQSYITQHREPRNG
ncbi:anti-phage dCTP deaminase [Rheinheimera mangrovi]|uniref:anti-phage dCTP deaminase n=1 Tax=Rheinheimera mangrovi TaxID=2498451 RepID=UPI000F8D1802|nr:anti-phage dCTP deaminase [Rheinheimera mangrovi]